jgi:hypothetical protein
MEGLTMPRCDREIDHEFWRKALAVQIAAAFRTALTDALGPDEASALAALPAILDALQDTCVTVLSSMPDEINVAFCARVLTATRRARGKPPGLSKGARS